MRQGTQASVARKAATVVAAGTTIVSLAGCGGGSSSADALQKIIDRGTLNAGSCLAQPPWGYIDSQGKKVGFDLDLAQFIAKDLGVKLDTVETTSASRVPSLKSGKVDIVSCSFTVNAERKKQIDFTEPTLMQGNSLAVDKNSSIKSLADLTGKRCAVSTGGTSIAVTKAANPGCEQQSYDSFATALLALKQGQADAMIDTSSVLNQQVQKYPNLKTILDGDVGPKVNFAIGVRQGEPKLMQRLNEIIKKWHSEKAGTALYEKWFKAKPTFEFKGLE